VGISLTAALKPPQVRQNSHLLEQLVVTQPVKNFTWRNPKVNRNADKKWPLISVHLKARLYALFA
jgi:hypothetical protein